MIAKFYKGLNEDAKEIRELVFVKEQGFQEEFDELDDVIDHAVIYSDYYEPMATGRFYEEDKDAHIFKLGRIAVLPDYRRLGLGRIVVKEMEDKAIEMGAKGFHISAQVVALPFYHKCGYKEEGDTYYEEHVEHIAMYKQVK